MMVAAFSPTPPIVPASSPAGTVSSTVPPAPSPHPTQRTGWLTFSLFLFPCGAALPQVSNEIKAEMVLAEFESDGDGTEGMIAFLGSIDLKEFARLLTKSQMTLEKLQQSSVQDLKRLGLPAGAQKKIYSALHPQ